MSDAYRRLSHDFPSRRSADTLSFPTDPKRIKGWIEALPRANHALTYRQLAEALEVMREVRLDGAVRLTILEQLRPVLLEAMSVQAQAAQGGTIPMPPAKQRAMDLLTALERDLALAYRIALVEYCAPSGSVPFLRGSSVAQGIERAVYHSSRCLMHAYFLYHAPPTGLWKSMHALFEFAKGHKLEDRPVDDPAERTPVSTHQLYSQALLLALSNPFRFSQREQAELWVVGRDLALQLPLHERRQGDDLFAIPLESDDGPGYIPEERAAEQGRLLWLDLTTLRAAMEQPLAQTPSGPVQLRFKSGKPVNSTAELLRRLRGGWGTAATRGHQRLNAGHGLDSVFGLSAVHFHLAGMVDFDTFLRQTGLAETQAERERAAWTHAPVDINRIPVHRAAVLDQSLGGYRIHWSAAESVRAKVGELVGLTVAISEDERQWMLGVVRWLRYAADGSVDAGIELLARRARPIAVRSLDPPAGSRPTMRGIQYLPLREAAERALRLVAPSVLETQQGKVELIRFPDPDDFDSIVPMHESRGGVRVLENAGEYQLLEASGGAVV